jgi:DNA polymerase elongation subunit (family B)
MNASYGIFLVPYYKKVFDSMAGGDCTRIGRQWIKYFRKCFRDAGFVNIMTDTDSVVVKGDREKILAVKDKAVNDILVTVPFPQDLFNMKIEAEVKYIYFFKGKDEDTSIEDDLDEDDFINKSQNLMKKNYIYVTKDDKLVVKNLGIQKKSNTPLSKKIFWEHLVPEIKKGTIEFKRTYIKNLMMELLTKDLSLIMLRKEVGPIEQYIKSPGSIHAQIAQRYGVGIHFIIPNNASIGVGKDKKRYCTMEEFKARGLTISNIDLDNVWKELDYFLVQPKIANLFDYVEEKKDG